ncbi:MULTISPECIES: phosphotransferase [Micromonospora]|uniref:phosphotransferase n=1 Tax=Micromonospora TaxID=1873 RepID=UPI001E64122F|nr:phosphotransferase [Micromonospora sp. NBRC 110038]
MTIQNPTDPLRRIHRPELVTELLGWAAAGCGLGTVRGHVVCDSGYDDCNLTLSTTRGRYHVKIFTTERPRELTLRYVDLLRCVIAAGVSHPALHPAGGADLLHHRASGNLLVVMDHLDGGTFFDRGGHPNPAQLADLIRQVRLVHSIERDFAPLHDWWATPNMPVLAREVLPLLPPEDQRTVTEALESFATIDLANLPRALVHGDLTKANVVPTSDTTVAVLDFAVANRYPRIHELSMIVVNLMHGDPRDLDERLADLTRRYGSPPLTDAELAALPAYVYATAAMELLGAAREAILKGNDGRENTYLLSLGRAATAAARRIVRREHRIPGE